MALALFAGYYLADAARTKRWQLIIIVPLIVVGVASSTWEVLAMGVSKYSRPPQIPTNVFQAFQALPENTSPDLAVVQHRIHDDFSRVQPGYADRFNGYSTSEAISVGSGAPRDLALAIELAKQAFLNRLPLRSYQLFWSLGADYAFVGPTEQEPDYYPQKFSHPLYFTPVYDQSDVAVFEIQPLFSNEPLATFDNNAIEFLGYVIDTTPTFPGEEPTASDQSHNPTPGFVTAWRLTRPADKDYTVFIHLVDAQGNIIAQADHQLWAWDVTGEGPTSSWTPGLPHLDIIPVPEAALTAEKPLTIRLGLWLPTTEQQFQPNPVSLDTDEAGRLIVGELN
jgi:hypothetical protein